ncbi:MAG: hypothetical protein HZA88_05390 [Verrucomicrobia bacterium]|nr:hypothetical protein [Verrucomicrobiota bacterium]
MNYAVIFFVSFLCILLELFWTRILNLKAWNHVVYTVIPFAILGYGIGANLQMVLARKFSWPETRKLFGALLFVLGLAVAISTWAIIRLPINIEYLENFLVTVRATGMLLAAYTLFMLPFVIIGFLVVHLFATSPKETHKLYCVDLVGAAVGAASFFALIEGLAVVRSLLALSVVSVGLGIHIWLEGKVRWVAAILSFAALVLAIGVTEPTEYVVDPKKGWEWIPGQYKTTAYDKVSIKWHPLGRTDVYRIKDAEVRAQMSKASTGTFQVNISPAPEFAYFTSNFLAGTPVYRFGDVEKGSQHTLKPFSCAMEIPYVLLTAPRVMVIGAGGGRDVFMARTHGAREIVGAEINSAIVRAMSPGGEMYEYSGRIYDAGKISCVDGRHLARTAPRGYYDLVVLNGVDTFSGLSSGAYAYAESYLYTKNALVDYLRALNERGVVNFNRWLFSPPRETLRLMAVALEALREIGIQKPWEHILIGAQSSWSITLIRKTPFTSDEIARVAEYFRDRDARLLYPTPRDAITRNTPSYFFNAYADAFLEGKERVFAGRYPYDISVITDDNPFFYKYYKFHAQDFLRPRAFHHTGSIIFWTQLLVLGQAIFFSLLFIAFPLAISRETSICNLPRGQVMPLVLYFACLGLGYMFVELPFMQKFVLLLGSPIHSISIVLAGLLFWTGVGSLILPRVQRFFADDRKTLLVTAASVVALLLVTIALLGKTQEIAMSWPFPLRAMFVGLWLAPVGVLLGFFFPLGLRVVGTLGQAAVAWAWGINCGFSVLGSMLAISIAQFAGFNAVILMAAVVYVFAWLAFRRMRV